MIGRVSFASGRTTVTATPPTTDTTTTDQPRRSRCDRLDPLILSDHGTADNELALELAALRAAELGLDQALSGW